MIAPTINTATKANIRGNRDLSNCVRKNVSLALEPVILEPTMQKNMSIKRIIGERSSGFMWNIFINIIIEIS